VTVYLVGAGPGDPGLLTRRGAQLLAQADVVIYDRLVHRSVLAIAPESAELIDVGKRPGAADGHQRQEQINQLLIEHGRRSRTVVRLKGGDPFLFGRGGEEVEVLSQAGIPWEVVPGVTSAFGAAAAAGIPVTHRGLASLVTVVTGRVGDASSPDGVDWEALAKVDGTLVVLMGMASRAEIALALQRGGKDPGTPVAVIEKGSTPAQRVIRTTLDGLADVSLGSPAIIVVGPVASMGVETSPSDEGALAGRTIVTTRAANRAKGLVEALEFEGARVIEMPLTAQVVPVDDGAELRAQAAHVGDYHWVIFTSVNAVDALMAEVRDARALGPVKVAAVGPATADALRRAGIEPDLVPAEHSADALVEAFPTSTDATRARVLFPSADIAPPTVADGLGKKGWTVTRVDAYRTVDLPSPDPDVLTDVARADAVTFTATSSVQAYLALRTPEGLAVPTPSCVLCIGAATAESARSLGLTGVIEAPAASTAGMVAALVEHFAGRRGVGS
jgi:uroporphyrinogen III methyltransferase/synthase